LLFAEGLNSDVSDNTEIIEEQLDIRNSFIPKEQEILVICDSCDIGQNKTEVNDSDYSDKDRNSISIFDSNNSEITSKTSKSSKTVFRCDFIGCKFETIFSESFLRKHKLIHRKVQLFACSHPECDFTTIFTKDLKIHENTHNYILNKNLIIK
jgi:hypothetical protein